MVYPLDPNTATREQFSIRLLEAPTFPDANEDWRGIVDKLTRLLRLLTYHSGMRPNLQQPYMTPANVKTKVYFMWDFIARTLSNAYHVPHDVSRTELPEFEEWQDVLSRSSMAAQLILDTNAGMLDMMVESTYPGQSGELPFGQRPEFGDEIKGIARELADTISMERIR